MSEQKPASVKNSPVVQKPSLVEQTINDEPTFVSGFVDLFSNKHFWIVMVFMIAIITGIYYYYNYIRTNDNDDDSSNNLENKNDQQMLQQQMLQQQMMQQQMIQQQMMQQQMMQPHKKHHPQINHPKPDEDEELPPNHMMELEEENENVQNQKLTAEEMELLTKQLALQE